MEIVKQKIVEQENFSHIVELIVYSVSNADIIKMGKSTK